MMFYPVEEMRRKKQDLVPRMASKVETICESPMFCCKPWYQESLGHVHDPHTSLGKM
jgi:hypothetical protein